MSSDDAWRSWGAGAPAWVLRFFLSDAGEDDIEALDQLAALEGPEGELAQLLEGVADEDIRVTITIERRGE